jgi:hypothetical protein
MRMLLRNDTDDRSSLVIISELGFNEPTAGHSLLLRARRRNAARRQRDRRRAHSNSERGGNHRGLGGDAGATRH